MPDFSTVQLDVAQNYINEYVIKNNSRCLRGVTKSSSALNFGMFTHSTTSISRFARFIFKTSGFGQLLSFSRVNGSFSTAAHLLILSSGFSYSLTKLQNYSLCESLINSFEVPKSEKTTTTKQINKSLKKHHGYIYWVSHWLSKIQSPWPFWSIKVTANLKPYLYKCSV